MRPRTNHQDSSSVPPPLGSVPALAHLLFFPDSSQSPFSLCLSKVPHRSNALPSISPLCPPGQLRFIFPSQVPSPLSAMTALPHLLCVLLQCVIGSHLSLCTARCTLLGAEMLSVTSPPRVLTQVGHSIHLHEV
jgi:hypothetical protein